MPYLSARLLYRIQNIHSSIEDRAEPRAARMAALKSVNEPILKTAFDTRRTNQDTDFNPRRNLQQYHRSDPFISEGAAAQLKTFFKLKTAVDSIKDDFVGDPDWLDSYVRILSTALDKTLRIEQKDMDYFQPQLDYLNEMLYLRYRLKQDDIDRMNEKELRSAVLAKDEKLTYKQLYSQYNNGGLRKDTSKQESLTVGGLNNSQGVQKNSGSLNDRGVNITINVT
jgi:hypothetical protein